MVLRHSRWRLDLSIELLISFVHACQLSQSQLVYIATLPWKLFDDFTESVLLSVIIRCKSVLLISLSMSLPYSSIYKKYCGWKCLEQDPRTFMSEQMMLCICLCSLANWSLFWLYFKVKGIAAPVWSLFTNCDDTQFPFFRPCQIPLMKSSVGSALNKIFAPLWVSKCPWCRPVSLFRYLLRG